jgi:molecular chaperone GrpE
MDKEYDETKPLNTVLKVVKKGYLFKDRILRPSSVVINIKPEPENKEIIIEEPENGKGE